MVESVHIAEQAEKAASELFSEFFWDKIGPTNHDWPCEDTDRHKATEHPCDVVYFYDEPYAQVRTYVHCDLKSYAKGSINATAVKTALESLSKQVACADKSDRWRDLHVHKHITASICGLLFVYNHDGEYESDFQKNLVGITPDSLDLPRGARLFVLGPKEIFWLDNIRREVQLMRGKAVPELPAAEYCSYYYPQLNRRANVQVKKAKAATLELLTSPIIILEYQQKGKRGIVVFYSRKGETTDEFIYLIDVLRKYELLDEDTSIVIKTLGASPISSPTFQKAQQQYVEGLAGRYPGVEVSDSPHITSGESLTDLGVYVNAIRYEPMTSIRTTYSSIDLGTWG